MELHLNKNKTKLINVRVNEDSYEKIKDIAEKENVRLAEVVRALIDAALKELEK